MVERQLSEEENIRNMLTTGDVIDAAESPGGFPSLCLTAEVTDVRNGVQHRLVWIKVQGKGSTHATGCCTNVGLYK